MIDDPDRPREARRTPYGEPLRPRFHYTPARNWLNDPNGLVHHRGEYHLFYQHNPAATTWDERISWGHAVSPDLIRWTELPVAIPATDEEAIYSGSAVVDERDTSGFGRPGEPAMVAIYTSARQGSQAQSLASSTDLGRTWTKYAGNPVLDVGSAEFRDPKVFWHAPERRWVMCVALAEERKVVFYASPDLKRWTHLSDFGPAGADGGVWECPDLVEIAVDGDPRDTRWLLTVSLNPGAIAGGSGTQYFLGRFDGRRFVSDAAHVPARPDGRSGRAPRAPIGWLDFGADHYAAVSYNGAPGGRALMIGWMSNWRYAGETPPAPWRGAMSTPREVTLHRRGGEVEVRQRPVAALATLRGRPRRWERRALAAGTHALDLRGVALDLEATFAAGTAGRVGLEVRRGGDERTVVGYDARTSEVLVDRTRSGEAGSRPGFRGERRAPLALEQGRVRLRVLVDATSVEVFAGDGARVISEQVFPAAGSDGVALFATGGDAVLERLEAYPLRSIWPSD